MIKSPYKKLYGQMLWLYLALFLSSASVVQAQRTEIVRTIALESLGSGSQKSIGVDSKGNLAASWLRTNSLWLWADDGAGGGIAGDGVANGAEVRKIADGGSYNSLGHDQNGNLALSYFSLDRLALWIDDGRNGGIAGNGKADGEEIRIIDPDVPSGSGSSIVLDGSGYLAISYVDDLEGSLKLWVDDGFGGGTAGDGVANGGEVRTLEGARKVAVETAIAVTDDGYLAVSYADGVNFAAEEFRVWIDDGRGGGIAGDGFVNGEEVRVIDDSDLTGIANAIGFDKNGNLAVAYTDSTSASLKLWVDDGAGGGIAGDRQVDASEVRVISSSSVGVYISLTLDSNGNLALSFQDDGKLKLWVDDGAGGGTAGDNQVNGTEIRTVDAENGVGSNCSITVDSVGNLAIVYSDQTNDLVKLARVAVYEPETIATLDSGYHRTMATVDRNGNFAVGYFAFGLELWVDDGRGGGVAGDGLANGSEIRTIDDYLKLTGEGSILLTPDGNLAIGYYDSGFSKTMLWVDDGRGGGTAGDSLVNGGEIREIANVGVDDEFSILGLHDGKLALSFADKKNQVLTFGLMTASEEGRLMTAL